MQNPHHKVLEYKPPFKKCRLCGDSNLEWIRLDGNWRLGFNGVVHSCKNYKKQKIIDNCHHVQELIQVISKDIKIDFSPLGIEVSSNAL